MDGWMSRKTERLIDRVIYGRMDRRGWMDGWVNGLIRAVHKQSRE